MTATRTVNGFLTLNFSISSYRFCVFPRIARLLFFLRADQRRYPYYTPGSGACKACPEILSQILRIFCEIRVIPQFFDVLEIKFQTEFKWDTNERGGMLQRMKFFTLQTSQALRARYGLRLPASNSCCKQHLCLAGRGPNSNALYPPPAAVVAVAPSRGALGRPSRFRGQTLRYFFCIYGIFSPVMLY